MSDRKVPIHIRIPDSLRESLKKQAKAQQMSLCTYLIRCMENIVKEDVERTTPHYIEMGGEAPNPVDDARADSYSRKVPTSRGGTMSKTRFPIPEEPKPMNEDPDAPWVTDPTRWDEYATNTFRDSPENEGRYSGEPVPQRVYQGWGR